MTNFTQPPAAPPDPVAQPSRKTDPQEQFDVKTDAYLTWQTAFRDWLAGMRAWCVTMLSEMTQATDQVEQARATSVQQADLAMGYRNTAGQHASNAAGYANTALGYRDQAGAAAGTATTQAGAASTARAATEAVRDQTLALGAQVLIATSTTSLVPGTGAKALQIETGRAYVVGMRLVLTSASDGGSQMTGLVNSYDRSTGALSMTITAATGSTARADWVIGIAAGGTSDLPVQVITANTVAQAGACYVIAAAGITLTLPAAWTPGDRIQWIEAIGAGALYTVAMGSTPLRGRAPGSQLISARYSGTPVLRYQDTTRGLI
ncbi:hypothetical protein [Paracidovorax cattleyae]|uniref:hypothetical protein n=1 Tax=Paracidovorax cattleyae TaxID=80868 RepID=UPI0018AFCB5F|nr:hypothetical protein [Paracidovorax cattleyae]MBF9263400.1 hypothetical protein [Paracidovorax cattleyae]